MLINTEGIVFRQIKASSGRRMVLLFTKKYGKISAGTSITERGRTKAALALSPFVYGNYELFKNREYYNLNSGEAKKSFYSIGEDIDKYMYASFILELTDKLIPEEVPQPKLFNLLLDFLEALEKRKQSYETLVLAYEVKALELLGTFPEMDCCTCCGKKEKMKYFSVKDGGMVCCSCNTKKHTNVDNTKSDTLIFEPKFDIVDILKYFSRYPLYMFEKIELDAEVAKELQRILRAYMSYHLDIGTLKSESIFNDNF